MNRGNSNTFTQDRLDDRSARLRLLSANIGKYMEDLKLPEKVASWAVNASSVWDEKRVLTGFEQGSQNVGFETFQRLFKELRDHFILLKQLLLTIIKYENIGDEVIVEYGLAKAVSSKRSDLKDAVDRMEKTSIRLRAEGDPRVLSKEQIDELVFKCKAMEESWHKAHLEKQQSVLARRALRRLFRQDSVNLRYVLTTARYVWSKFDPKLKDLGFSNVNRYNDYGRPPTPGSIEFVQQAEEIIARWEKVEDATSYQLWSSKDEKNWELLYKGKELSCSFPKPEEKRFYRVRARNIHGYSKWSGVD